MAEVRKENGEALEYVCPECGATFTEGSKGCPNCGLEFDWSAELEYLCPECGTVVDPDQARCPGCGARFSKEDNGDVLIEYEPEGEPPSVEELLEAAIDEARVRPRKAPERKAPERQAPERQAPERQAPAVEREPVKQTRTKEGAPTRPKALSKEKQAKKEPTGETVKLYPGGFTRLGVVFVSLALLAFIFTLLVARYDTWIQGAAEESMGDNQRMVFFAGLMGFAVSIVIAVYDLLRTPRRHKQTTA